MRDGATFFQRMILPGFAFKAVIIGGGYATGRELVEFFFPSGPLGGLLGIALVAMIWSAVATVTFLFARATASYDYRTFFKNLLGPLWPVFEVSYILLVLLIISVFGAAAGEIGYLALGLPRFVGALALMAAITAVTMAGNEAVEGLFKYVSILLYGVYALIITLVLTRFGDRIGASLALDIPPTGWVQGGMTYAGYNLLGAVVILPVTRHFTGKRDAVIAGMLCGPLAALPALLFFLCMLAFYPEIGSAVIPSDVLLSKLNIPVLHILFQIMVFAALLESGVGLIHAINERVAGAFKAGGRVLSTRLRVGVTVGVLIAAMLVATRFGLVELIAKGYGMSALLLLVIYVVPLMSIGLWRVFGPGRRPLPAG